MVLNWVSLNTTTSLVHFDRFQVQNEPKNTFMGGVTFKKKIQTHVKNCFFLVEWVYWQPCHTIRLCKHCIYWEVLWKTGYASDPN